MRPAVHSRSCHFAFFTLQWIMRIHSSTYFQSFWSLLLLKIKISVFLNKTLETVKPQYLHWTVIYFTGTRIDSVRSLSILVPVKYITVQCKYCGLTVLFKNILIFTTWKSLLVKVMLNITHIHLFYSTTVFYSKSAQFDDCLGQGSWLEGVCKLLLMPSYL